MHPPKAPSLEHFRLDVESIRLLRALRRGCTDDDGVRLLTRSLTDDERSLLLRRAAYLEHAAAFASAKESAMEISGLLSRWPSARASGEEAQIIVAQYVSTLSAFPLWAIKRACEPGACAEIEGYNPAFPPSAEQLFLFVRNCVQGLERERAEIKETLSGRVEELLGKPSKAQLEERLRREIRGRPLRPVQLPGDGKHAQRVAADLAARRERNEGRVAAE